MAVYDVQFDRPYTIATVRVVASRLRTAISRAIDKVHKEKGWTEADFLGSTIKVYKK